MKILITGGTGYIGSHTFLALRSAGYQPIIIDNLCNSKRSVLKRLAALCGQEPIFYQGDIQNRQLLHTIFQQHTIQAVIHFAALKSVGESTQVPLTYYTNNLTGTLILLDSMQHAGVHNLIFSSSATVYGSPAQVPIDESFPCSATNPYGRSKLFIEQILQDLHTAKPHWSITLLRYFNPVGAHESGLIGEDPQGIPNNLMPYLTQVAIGRREKLSIFGNDYPTADGTGIRDYIHVMDLAEGHVKALYHCADHPGVHCYNLGTGQGYSVLQLLNAFSATCQRSLPYQFVPRRSGDIAECWADPTKAKNELNWQTQRSLQQMCDDSWRWQLNNPHGYEE